MRRKVLDLLTSVGGLIVVVVLVVASLAPTATAHHPTIQQFNHRTQNRT